MQGIVVAIVHFAIVPLDRRGPILRPRPTRRTLMHRVVHVDIVTRKPARVIATMGLLAMHVIVWNAHRPVMNTGVAHRFAMEPGHPL
jgi:hypothetical protein